jgi:hypothetical protein
MVSKTELFWWFGVDRGHFITGLGQFDGRVRLDEIFAVKMRLRADEVVFFG